jgi:endonuclease/exonuclease/phosphatase family metal-dependent hydrolase
MKVLNLNCQHRYQSSLESFLLSVLNEGIYDFLLLQEVSEEVSPLLDHPSYKIARTFNSDAGKESELCIVYKASADHIETHFQSFSPVRHDPVFDFKHPSFGILWADFKLGSNMLRLASIHLHSGMNRRCRIAELDLVKLLLKDTPIPMVLTGDFNAGYPGEASTMAHALAPEFSWITKHIGPTLDSYYSENVAHLPNRIAAFLRIFNISIKLKADHAFVNHAMNAKFSAQCSLLPNRVSDHSPMQINFNLRKKAV